MLLGGWVVVVFDAQGDIELGRAYFDLVDLTPPNVTDLRPIAGSMYNISDTVEISANITDNIKVNNAFVNITLPNGTVEQLTLVKTIYNKYNTSFTIPNLPGYYDIRFIARDPSNNTNASETTYFIVGEYEPPSVFNVAPTKNSTFNSSEKIEIGANVTDNVAVDTVLANIALPNGTIQELTLSRVDFTDRYNITYTLPNLAGRFNVTFVANDASGNVNDSETTYFNVKNEFLFQATVKDAVGIPVNITIEFVYLDGTVAYSETKISHSAVLQKGVYNISVKPVNHPVKEILFTNYNANKDIDGIVEIDDTSEQIESSKQRTNFKEIFAINPLLVGFDSAVVTKSAIGEDLYKCSRWVFNERKCYGQWIKIQDISPGENYSFTLTPNDPSFGEGEEKIILTTITVDGNFSDWSAVLQSPNNLVVDGAGSINDPSDLDTGMKANNDLSKFAFTWDDDKIYFYFERVFPARGLTSGLVYIDLDNDGYMNSTDKVVILTSTPAGNYDLFLYDYSPNATADILTGDGFDMPGTVTNQTGVGSNIQGIDADGIKVELEINWSMLGVIAGSPLQMHASLAKGDASVLPDDIEDNSDIATTSVVDILITPNNVIGTQANQSVLFNHTITNRGNVLDVVDVTTSGTSTNWTVQLLYQNGTLLTDTDGDTIVDVGQLSINQSVNIIVNISIPAGQGTIQDITIVTAASSVNANVSDSVTDTIFVGQGITIYPENMGWIAANTTIFYIHTIRNGRGISDVIDVSAVSNNNWSTSLFYANGTPLTDTDSDTIVDVGNLTAGDSVDIKISITIPSVSIGTIDETTLTINSSIGTISSSVIDTTTIAERVIIEPLSQQLQEAGIGTTVFYQFAVYNNWNESDTININFFSSEGWPIELLEQDEVTPLTDTNNDSIIDTGTLDANGGSTTIVMKITVPVGTQVNTTDTTNITATSSLDSSAFDISYVNTSAVILLTFSDAARLQKSTLFSLGDTIYATAFGISQNRIQFYWLDANATLVRSSGELDPGPAGTINDQYTSNVTTDIPGEWVLILHDRKLEEITRTTFFVDIGPPQVVVISPVNGSRFNQSDTVIISANVTDDVQVDTVLANITFPNSTVQQLTLSQVNDTNQYNALFNATNLTGRYNITFIANETIGNVNDSETTWFYVGIIPPTAPILFSPYYNTSIIDRTPTFIWNNSYDPDFDSLTYEIIVDNSSLFDSPEISTGDIPETLIQTNYTSTIELEVDKVYYWRVRAYDNYTYSNWSTVFYFTLESYAAISLLVDTVNFSTVMPSYTDDTADDNPPPFLLENQGNIQVNITMTGTQMFNSTPFPSDNFQFKIDQNESSAFEYSPSTTSWTNITNVSSRIDIVSLDWHDISDTAEGDIRISVPGEEPSGIRTSNITFSVI